jgi:hypothetical protein
VNDAGFFIARHPVPSVTLSQLQFQREELEAYGFFKSGQRWVFWPEKPYLAQLPIPWRARLRAPRLSTQYGFKNEDYNRKVIVGGDCDGLGGKSLGRVRLLERPPDGFGRLYYCVLAYTDDISASPKPRFRAHDRLKAPQSHSETAKDENTMGPTEVRSGSFLTDSAGFA